MPSLRSHIVALVVRNWHRSAFTSPEGLHRWIRWARQRESHRPPRTLDGRFDIASRTVAGFPVYEVRAAPGRKPAEAALPAWRRLCLPDLQLPLEPDRRARRTASARPSPCRSIRSRRNTASTRCSAWCMEVYRDMLRETAAADIAMVGDSAGGNMAVVLTMMAAQSGLPSPGRHVLISPGLDMSLSNPDVYRGRQASIRGSPFRAGWRRSASTPKASTAPTGASARSTAISRCCRRRCCSPARATSCTPTAWCSPSGHARPASRSSFSSSRACSTSGR